MSTPISLLTKWRALQDAIADSNLSPTAKSLYAVLLDCHNNRTKRCDPARETLASRIGLSASQVTRAMTELDACGYVKRRYRRGTTSIGFPRLDDAANMPHQTARKVQQICTGSRSKSAEAASANMLPLYKPRSETTKRTHEGTRERDSAFEKFYAAYPRKKAPRNALKVFERIVQRGEATAEELIAGAARYAEDCRVRGTEPRYVKYPASWLNGGCWADEPDAPTVNGAEHSAVGAGLARFVRGQRHE